MNKTLALLFAMSLAATADAQRRPERVYTKTSKLSCISEIGIAGAENKVVAKAFEYVRAFTEAGVRDGEPENWMCRMFLTKHTMNAAPLRFRLYTNEVGRRRVDSPLVHLDYEKAIDFGEMFSPMRTRPLPDVKGGFYVQGMHIVGVPRPGGGFRMNFARERAWGEDSSENEMFTGYHEVEAPAPDERLMKRLRHMPIHVQFDANRAMNHGDAKGFSGLFGPSGALLSGSVTALANRPVIDVYSGMRPGEGLVGQSLDRKPGAAVILGHLAEKPGLLLVAALGETLPRSLMTLLKAAPEQQRDAAEVLTGFLESFDGRITLVASGLDPGAELPEEPDLEEYFDTLGHSLRGTMLFGISDDSAKEIVEDLVDLMAGPKARQLGLPGLEVVEHASGKSFRIGPKFLALGAGEGVVGIGVGRSAAECRALLRHALRGDPAGKKVRPPKKFTMVNGRVKLWISAEQLRHVAVWFRGVHSLFGRSVENRRGWIGQTLERDVLSEGLAASLEWSRRFGTMLRVLF